MHRKWVKEPPLRFVFLSCNRGLAADRQADGQYPSIHFDSTYLEWAWASALKALSKLFNPQ